MSKPVITAFAGDNAVKIASLMRSKGVGSVVVVDDASNPVGVITERDLVNRIISKGLNPSTVKAETVMSRPLNTISPGATITEASKLMRTLKVRRLIVVKQTRLLGVISSDDIVKITPELITIISGELRMGGVHPAPRKAGLAGRCDSCDQWSNNLKEHEGLFICEDCYTDV